MDTTTQLIMMLSDISPSRYDLIISDKKSFNMKNVRVQELLNMLVVSNLFNYSDNDSRLHMGTFWNSKYYDVKRQAV